MGENGRNSGNSGNSETKIPTGERIVRAAVSLLEEGGREAVSTRAVSAAAGVQPPAIYRLFGDMRGLLDAVAEYGMADYLRVKTTRERLPDPVDDLRRGWDLHIDFGLAHPALYTLMYGDPRPGERSPAARKADAVLLGLVERVAEAGRLRLGVERAAHMIHSASCGVTLTLLSAAPEERDPDLPRLTREAVLAAVTTDGGGASGTGTRPGPGDGAGGTSPVSHAVALRTAVSRLDVLSPGEAALFAELLDRIARSEG
ncbi:TetR/AcrR family transcriptional regulator [Streptomyces sp. TRM 70361]|uniref:TetR/AcrR family transcriptional regulator n=1 Tax=Streptomyces sp. TRM 70361 TaxID=3116553 RepID=UPI002E7B13DB|nr:TetR/AcrR family transcriptional regulator [Streptomyces sp. TRM 70361]MEE1939900.1 TetR/AcrR family transcriptional regulator [Streptomyces sp. TRM 70361]